MPVVKSDAASCAVRALCSVLIGMSVRGGLYTVNVDQSSAKHLTRDGGTLLLLEVPQGTVVGVDQQVSAFYSQRYRNRQRKRGYAGTLFVRKVALLIAGP